jgi:hypothetical protein
MVAPEGPTWRFAPTPGFRLLLVIPEIDLNQHAFGIGYKKL